MNRKKRDKNLIFKVNEDEWNIIQKRLEKCNVSNMSDLFRQMMLYGIYLEYDHEELKKNTAGGYACGNQIAHRVNATSRIYKQELYELQEGVTEIWQQLQSIQSELQKLNPSSIL